MRPLRLRMSAFGPFPGSVEIDFRALGPDGLFLIHGATGAGKTSILDGLSFALFGRASGSDRSPDGMRSDLASDDITTEAILEFAIGGTVYRARRQPRQSIKKKRGEGLREVKPDGSLEKLSGGGLDSDLDNGTWELIESGEKKTDAAINELLGMSEDQFRQVVVLPQGQFRKFLSASSDEREKLLARLFRTDRFRNIEEALEDSSRHLAEQISSRRRNLESLLASLEVETPEMLASKLDEMSVRLEEIKKLEPEIKNNFESTSLKLDVAREARRNFEELSVAQAHQIEIEKARPDFIRKSKKIEDEKRARPVLVLHSRLVTLVSDLDRVSKELASTRDSQATTEKSFKSTDDEFNKLSGVKIEIEKARGDRDRLKEVYAGAKKLGETRERLSALMKSHADLEREVSVVDTESLDQALAVVLSKTASSAMLLSLSSEKIERAEIELKKNQLRYHLSEASRLATQLEDGKPCAVCGSKTHPKPATPVSDAPTREFIEKLELELATLQRTNQELKMALAKLDSERMAIEDSIRKSSLTQISPKTDSSIKKSEIKDPEASLKVELGNLRSALSALKTEIDRIEIERTKKTSKVEESRRSLDSMRGSLEQLESDVSQEDRDLDTLKTRGQALTKKIDEFDSSFKFLNENRDRLKTALASAVARTTTLEGERTHRESLRALTLKERDTALSNAGFTSVEECLECAISGADLSVLEKSVRDFERDSSLNAAKLSELTAKARTPAPTEEEVLALQTERAHALEKQTQILAEKLHLENSLRSMSAMKERISSMSAESEKLTLEHGKLGRLAEIAAGRHPNLSRVSFQRYVLAARLDEVLEQASRRLFTMSRGQFILRRSTSVEDKRRSAGLDVEVEDALSGKTRPTSSLSGGEGFLASLALAMGLSDVVQAHLGGVRLDAVFVDEGFGTLDPEALDLAMEVLSGLRSGGRIVGIISHVPELKDQIANRLVVRKSNAGSSVSWETSFV